MQLLTIRLPGSEVATMTLKVSYSESSRSTALRWFDRWGLRRSAVSTEFRASSCSADVPIVSFNHINVLGVSRMLRILVLMNNDRRNYDDNNYPDNHNDTNNNDDKEVDNNKESNDDHKQRFSDGKMVHLTELLK